jgi:hypothetical protein
MFPRMRRMPLIALAAGLAAPAGAGILEDCDVNLVDFNPTGAVQFFVVPDGVSEVTAYVRGGGGGIGDGVNSGGYATYASGRFAVTPGDNLTVIVGDEGGDAAAQSFCGGGGGGASVVALPGFIPQIVAGGGGGGGSYSVNHTVSDASLVPTGKAGDGSDGGAAGVGTQGGQAASGAGGGGASTAGGDVVGGGTGGAALFGAATGGVAGAGGANGGFGGGGASGGTQGCAGGGGGGGYSGGGGGGVDDAGSASGGGGGSYVAPGVTIFQPPFADAVSSPGRVYICYAVQSSVLEVPTLNRWSAALFALILAAAALVVRRRRA